MRLVSRGSVGGESKDRDKGGTCKDTKRDYLIGLILRNNQDVRSEFHSALVLPFAELLDFFPFRTLSHE